MYGRGPGYGGPAPYPPGAYAGQAGYAAGPLSYGAPPRPPAPYGYARQGIIPPKSTTMYIGRIPPGLSDESLQGLLQACGDVQSWKPTIDPDTGKSKGFGFVTYVQAEGVITALKVLNDREVDGQKLIAKTNKATQEYIDWLENDKRRTARPADDEAQHQREQGAMQKISAILGDRQGDPSAIEAAGDFLASLEPEVAKPAVSDNRSATLQAVEEEKEREANRRAYLEELRAWENHERVKLREQERELDSARNLERDRARALYADDHHVDSDVDEEPWRRRAFSQSSRSGDRRLRRQKEEQQDRQAMEEDARREEERRNMARAQEVADEREKEDAQRAAAAKAAIASADSQEAMYQAMLSVARDTVAAEQKPAGKKRRFTQAAFGGDEEEAAPQRKLIPISYTAEELAAKGMDELASAGPDSTAIHEHSTTVQPTEQPDPEVMKRKLMASVPKDQQQVFAWPLRWDLLDNAPPDVMQRIEAWVNKRIRALMGEEEETFSSFLMQQIVGHSTAEEVLEALKDVLDEDAPSFVTKLFQVLIYESLKLENGL